MRRSQWRTVWVALAGIAASIGGLAIVAGWPAAGAAYPAFCGAIGFCVGSVAAKSGFQSKVNPEHAEVAK